MVDTDGKPKRRLGVKAQLNPVGSGVRVNTADFNAPATAACLELSAVEVDKKLVRIGYGSRDAAGNPDLSYHARDLCNFSASAIVLIVEVSDERRRRYYDIRYDQPVNSLRLAAEDFELPDRYSWASTTMTVGGSTLVNG